MSKTTNQKNQQRNRFYWIAAGIIVVLIVLFFINQNNRSTSAIAITPTGNSDSVFIDRSRNSSLNPNTTTSYTVSAGQHQVLLARENHWPWTETLTLAEGETITVNPFLIEDAGRRVVQVEIDTAKALAQKENKATPSAENPVNSPDGNISVFVDNETNIIAQWTASTSSAPDYFNCFEGTCGVSVYNNQPVRDLAFYPNRNDVIFFSTDKGVYAIEINPTNNTQNFQPVVEGVSDPVFVLADDRIFVSVNGRITVSEI